MTLKKYNKSLLLNILIVFCLTIPSLASANNGPVCQVVQNYEKVAAANYQPGLDAQGNRVIAAELGNGPSSFLPDVIRIPVNIDLVQYVQQQLPAGMQMESNFGMVEIHPDGKVLYNDQDITNTTYAYCGLQAPALTESSDKAAAVIAKPQVPHNQPVATAAPAKIIAEPALVEPQMNEPELSEPVLYGQKPRQPRVSEMAQEQVDPNAPKKPIILGNPPRRSELGSTKPAAVENGTDVQSGDMLYGDEH